MIPFNITPPSKVTTSYERLSGPDSDEFYTLEFDKEIPEERYQIFFSELKDVYKDDFIWKKEANYEFYLKNGYSHKWRGIPEYNFPGTPRGIYIKLMMFSVYIQNIISLEWTEFSHLKLDPDGYIFNYKDFDLFERDIRRWNPPNFADYMKDINCLKTFSKYRLGYRTSVENIYEETTFLTRNDSIDQIYLDGSWG